MGRLRPGVPRALDLFLGGNAMTTTGGPDARTNNTGGGALAVLKIQAEIVMPAQAGIQ
jgi:hypothetical protein